MNVKKNIAVFMAVILLGGALLSCKKDDPTPEIYTPETVEPYDDGLLTDYTDDAEKLAYIEGLQNTFAALAPTDAASFTVTETETGVAVTGYVGSASEVRIPSEIDGKAVVKIADGAFSGNGVITRLYIPDSVTSIGTNILKGATALRALRTPLLGADANGAQYLGYLFGGAKHENNAVSVPTTLEYLEIGGPAQHLADFALFECDDLICVTLPESMKVLGAYSVYGCRKLTAINVDHLTAVEEHALDACSSLTRLDFGASLTSVGRGALEGCIGLRRLQLPFVGGTATENTYLGYIFGAAVPDFSGGYYPPYLNDVTLLDGCTLIGDYAFYECASLKFVSIPEGVASIGVRAFSGCVRMTAVWLPNSVATIRENAFFGCLSMEQVHVGVTLSAMAADGEQQSANASSLTSIGVNAFYNCGALQSIELPKSLTALPASCFAGCASLVAIDLGGVTQVGKNAFLHCNSLRLVTALPNVTFEDGNEAAKKLVYGEGE